MGANQLLSQVTTRAHAAFADAVSGTRPWWSAVLITASSARQAELYSRQIEDRRRRGTLPPATTVLVVPDPPGVRPGSGGATLNALAQLASSLSLQQDSSGAGALQDWWKTNRVLMIHSGGDSRRLPQFSATGKLFGALPVRAPGGGASTVFDETLALSTLWLERMDAGLVIGAGDVLLVFNPDGLDWRRPGVSGVGLWQPADVGSQHGVYVSGEAGVVYSFLQKPSFTEIDAAGGVRPDGRVAVDTGLLCFDPATAARLAGIACSVVLDGPLDLYTHFTQALTKQWQPASGAPEVQQLLSAALASTDFHCDAVEGEFSHIGTTRLFRQVMTEETDLSHLYASHSRLGSESAANVVSSGVVLDSVLGRGEVGAGALVMECCLEGSLRIARNSVAHGLSGIPGDLEIPEGTVVHQVQVAAPHAGSGSVIRVYGVEDDPKALADAEALWFGRPILAHLQSIAISPDDVWPGLPNEQRSLWNAQLFPVSSPSECWNFARWLMGLSPGDLSASWRNAERHSLASSAQWTDPQAEAVQRDLRNRHRWRATVGELAASGSDLRPMLAHAPGVSALTAAAALLEGQSAGGAEADPSRAASLAYQASLFYGQAGLEEKSAEVRTHAFSLVSKAVAALAGRSRMAPPDRFRLSSVTVSAPARIDFGGGWSDTPPFCLDWGGTVLNAAVALNGEYQIRCQARLLDSPTIRLRSEDTGDVLELTAASEELLSATAGDPFAISKCALRLTGLFHDRQPLPALLDRLGGGIEISTSADLPLGSGLGSSSILAAAVVRATMEMFGRRLSTQQVSDLVLDLEQMMGTGGGWQDQAGGIFPGIKLLSTAPGPQQRLRYQPLNWSLEREAELERLVVLAYTGIRRVARNLLQQVVGNYLARETQTIQVLHSIKTLALEMAHAMQDGDWDTLGALMNRHWELNQRMDPHTTNAPVEALLDRASPLIRGAKLAGAGGGGFMIFLAKSEEAAAELRTSMSATDWQIARDGLRVRRSEL
jgi:fucokinase